jgi:twitching motility protein PilT
MTDEHKESFDQEKELDFSYSLDDGARFRVNIYQQRGTLGAALRLIPNIDLDLGKLNLPPAVESLTRKNNGLVLVTGPTGSGKSTTLAAMINLINRERASHIVTIEDPIEYYHKHQRSLISQREIGIDSHSFANALKHVLRQDPDVILIGEMRDLETIGIAITAAETGHLVFGTLHTQDAPTTIDRIIDVFPPYQQSQIRTQLSICLQGVISQRLLRKAAGRGRVPAVEIMVVTPGIRNLVREGKTHQIYSAIETGKEYGMITMDQALEGMVRAGEVEPQMAVDFSTQPEEMAKKIGINR